MNIKNYLFICLIIAFFSTSAFSEVGYPLSEPDLTLLGKANPALAGIEQLHVFIVPSGADPNENNLFFKQLDVRVKDRFKQAGIKVAPVVYRGYPARTFDMPELKINIEMLKLKKLQRYVFRIQTTLSKKMYLSEGSSWFIKADVWKSASAMQAALNRNMRAAVTNIVLQQIESFIHAYLAANPKGPALADANDINDRPAFSKTVRRPQKQQSVQYQYVASRRSRVFHKPDCSSALRISPKNLVGFNSRDAAIRSGKRPCKRCKP